VLKIKAVIFDMDGLLLDSESLSLATFVEACHEHNFEPDLKVYYRCIGTISSRTREILREGYGSEFPLEDITTAWKSKYQEQITQKPIPLKKGAIALLDYLHSLQIPQAIVTSSRSQNAMLKLNKAGIAAYFVFVLGGDQISRGKPDPEIYLTACQKLNLDPAHCLALEDSDNGVRAAGSAGLRVIQVPDMLAPCEEVRRLGHTIVQSLVEVRDLFRLRFDHCDG
jgi:HAD superfamily hydrolase (TIGR01509 family)